MTADEVERLRLLLSTFRDGSGQFLKRLKVYMPDYLDFERATAEVCGGTTSEDKGVFDVAVPVPGGKPFGISCKMSTEQNIRNQSSFMELSNSHKKFEDAFAREGVDWRTQPDLAGPIIVDLVMSWHTECADRYDIASSKYLVLSHDKDWSEFRLLCFSLDLADPDPRTEVEWVNEGRDGHGGPSTVCGYIMHGDRRHRLWQLFQNSGGQLKYYPLLSWAEWFTEPFKLENPPIKGMRQKVDEYFPGRWPEETITA
ncbi:hypothetical protein PU560_08825 [Georgenia sp. 10Sc9-8]|uniref:Restriction endonuclease n=1 Tax=Georgenia halotolerans TaxID=3028317 RepID=A0ABT5TWZ0_9MICO|nr:hypothetical protein [Georgenia halotolerans]